MNEQNHELVLNYLAVLSKYDVDIEKAFEIIDNRLNKTTTTSDAAEPEAKAPVTVAELHPDMVSAVSPPKHPTDEPVEQNAAPQRYEEMIKTAGMNPPQQSGKVNISRPRDDTRDSRGISETGGAITNK